MSPECAAAVTDTLTWATWFVLFLLALAVALIWDSGRAGDDA